MVNKLVYIPNTFRMDVRAKIYAEYRSVDELRELLQQYRGERLLHIGAGSNLLFTGDFNGVVLHSAMRRARATREDDNHVFIEAENGLVLDDLIAQLCDMGLSGMENLSYIPGEVGASAVQNVGAYGVEAKDVITEVRALAIADGSERTFTNAECPSAATAIATVYSRMTCAGSISSPVSPIVLISSLHPNSITATCAVR